MEHLDREGLIREIEETFKVSVKQKEDDVYGIDEVKPDRKPYLVKLLRQEDLRGNLGFDEYDDEFV